MLIKIQFLRNKNVMFFVFFMILFAAIDLQTISAQVNVFDVSGDWRTSNATLKRGQSLGENDVIVNKSGNRTDYIILKSKGETLASRFCNREDCTKKLIITKRVSSSNSFVGRIWNSLMNYWEKEEYAVNIAKGGLEDDIVFIYKDAVNMSSYFQKQQAKKYRLKFVNHSNPKDTLQVDIDTTVSQKNVEIKGLSTGLYEMTDLKVPGAPTWILVVPIEKYCESKTSFSNFQEETKNWKSEEINPKTIKQFNRTFLRYLADSKSKK